MQVINFLVSMFLIVVVIVVIVTIKKLPDHISSSVLEKAKAKDNRQLQVESYFKQIGGKEQQKVFNEWTKFLTDITNNAKKYSSTEEGIKSYRQLMHDSIIYASDRTLTYISAYSSFIYSQKGQENPSDENTVKMLLYVAYIISSLKEDFSGYKIDPKKLIKMEINDYSIIENELDVAEKELKKEFEK